MLLDTVNKFRSIEGVTPVIHYVADPAAASFFADTFPDVQALPQIEGDLGERLETAFAHSFAHGFRSCVAIGTDSPDLPAAYVMDAFATMERNGGVVAGPAEDGGYYLIGSGRDRYDPQLFSDIPWSTEQVLETTLERCGEIGVEITLLPAWHDVDEAEDLERPELLDGDNGAPLTRQFLESFR